MKNLSKLAFLGSLTVLFGCSSMGQPAPTVEEYDPEKLAQSLVSIETVKLDENTSIETFKYISVQDTLCIQYIKSTKKDKYGLSANLGIYCEPYELNEEQVPQFTSLERLDLRSSSELGTYHHLVFKNQ
ncbi:hypothetical protein L1D14_07700 [Vibrio tubiashii]|uniref:hypothetical protein n=1 Tax=Vibrio tubiashii TaxID=29498 RepID=UPI001EFE4A02|nr:hypothetical protein [Vibrio tubiashii]MCG9576123.1 hypothetical protein [Vibrio tubiashii]